MLRITVRTTDTGDAMNIGGPVHESVKSFVIESDELEAYLQGDPSNKYLRRQVIGVEPIGRAVPHHGSGPDNQYGYMSAQEIAEAKTLIGRTHT